MERGGGVHEHALDGGGTAFEESDGMESLVPNIPVIFHLFFFIPLKGQEMYLIKTFKIIFHILFSKVW